MIFLYLTHFILVSEEMKLLRQLCLSSYIETN